jgi:hypothetical protein
LEVQPTVSEIPLRQVTQRTTRKIPLLNLTSQKETGRREPAVSACRSTIAPTTRSSPTGPVEFAMEFDSRIRTGGYNVGGFLEVSVRF